LMSIFLIDAGGTLRRKLGVSKFPGCAALESGRTYFKGMQKSEQLPKPLEQPDE
jgi:hypothetical protein